MGRIVPFEDISQAKSVRKPSGYVIIDGIEVARTLECVHGGETFISIRGSGITRGFCRNCMGETCGKPKCHECRPFEKTIDMYEKGIIKSL